MTAKTIRITYAGDTVTLTCDLSDASAPLVVDGDATQYQTADARHRTHLAVALAASVAWPDAEWPEVTGDHPIADDATEAWAALEYETLDQTAEQIAAEQITADTITDEQIEALRTEAAEAGDLAQVAICAVALYGRDGVDRSLVAATDEEWAVAFLLGETRARAACADAINEAAAR